NQIVRADNCRRCFSGAVSSVVEHYLDTVGVTGSNPVSRTILEARRACPGPCWRPSESTVISASVGGFLVLWRRKCARDSAHYSAGYCSVRCAQRISARALVGAVHRTAQASPSRTGKVRAELARSARESFRLEHCSPERIRGCLSGRLDPKADQARSLTVVTPARFAQFAQQKILPSPSTPWPMILHPHCGHSGASI
ncbi:MAG: hypothetical protein QOH24_1907, partial [Verrucomicrobiota bacterium]